jgi:hypothetical protein
LIGIPFPFEEPGLILSYIDSYSLPPVNSLDEFILERATVLVASFLLGNYKFVLLAKLL